MLANRNFKFLKLNSFLVHSFEYLFVNKTHYFIILIYVSSKWIKTWILRFIKEQEFISAYKPQFIESGANYEITTRVLN